MANAQNARLHRLLDEVIAAPAPNTYAQAVSRLLADLAEDAYAAALTVEDAWQEKEPGKDWRKLGKLLEGFSRRIIK